MSIELFHIIPEAVAVVRSKGTFFQKDVYRRGNRLYFKFGSGFVRIGAGDATSKPGVAIESFWLPDMYRHKVYLNRDMAGAPCLHL